MKKLLSLSVLIAILWGCCSVEDTPNGEKTASYKVEHYQQNTNDDGYTLVKADSENKNGKAGENTSVQAKTYEGFTAKTVEQVKITADGKAVVKIYYDRNIITLTLDLDGGEGETEITGKYGATVNIAAPTKSGYDFAGWNPELPTTFLAISTTYKAKWTAGNETTYKVEHYQQNIIDDEYILAETDTETGTTDEDTFATAKDYAGFTAKTIEQMKIAANGSTVVKIYYDRKEITLTLNLNGGEGKTEITGKYGADVTTLANPTKTGYTFAEWNPELPATLPAENVTYTASWNANTYTVKFEANGGSGTMTDQTFTYDVEQALTANTFTRKDYTFAGWAVKADGNATYADMAKVKNLTAEDKATVTLFAVWNENDKVLPVIFSVPSETAVDCGDSVTLSCATEGAKISYTIGDETAEYTDAITITKDVTITAFATKDGMKDSDESTASYIVKTYTVTYKSDYDTAPSKIAGLKKGDKLTAEQLPVLTTDGYTFAGWYNGENEVTTEYKISSDLNLTAKWNANTDTAYKVEHYQQNIDNDEYVLAEADTENKTGTTDTDTVATAKDYAGFTAKTIEQEKIAADGSTVVKIYYDRKEITLILNLDGGEGETEITGKYEEAVTTPANPTRTGYTFAGWNSDLPETFPAENATYTAKWNANTDTAYTVEHYQQNIADDEYILTETDTETGTTDEDTSATAKDYAGFTAKSVTQEKIAANGSTVVKIYYDRKEITLTLDLDDGEGETEITGKYGAIVTTPANPTKTGYTFASWNPELPATLPAENATYIAQWKTVTYTITYNLDGGTNAESNPTSYTVETDTITLANATRNGYAFLGWYDENGDKITQITKKSIGDITLYAKWKTLGKVGDIIYSDGSVSEDYDNTKTPIGIVIEVSDEGIVTKIVSLAGANATKWSTEKIVTKATSKTDGKANMEAIQAIEGWEEKYLAFKWCDDYTDASGNSQWYLPAKNELNQLYKVKNYVNATIDKIIAGGGTATELSIDFHWSSSECSDSNAYRQIFLAGVHDNYNYSSKSTTYSVRAIRAF